MRFWTRIRPSDPGSRSNSARLRVEALETRLAPAVRLDLVALHEFGHSLGLGHDSSNAVSIMDPYYNANYDMNYFLSGADPAVAALRAKFANLSTSPWNDSNGNGVADVTYSFMRDGARMDSGRNNLFQTMNGDFGSQSVWMPIFTEALDRWAQVSGGKLEFINLGIESQVYDFNISGSVQNDSRFGDIRIGAHRMPGTVIAHAYYPPPNGRTAAGDAHFDSSETWVLAGALSAGGATGSGRAGSSGLSNGNHGHGHGHGNEEEGSDDFSLAPGDDSQNSVRFISLTPRVELSAVVRLEAQLQFLRFSEISPLPLSRVDTISTAVNPVVASASSFSFAAEEVMPEQEEVDPVNLPNGPGNAPQRAIPKVPMAGQDAARESTAAAPFIAPLENQQIILPPAALPSATNAVESESRGVVGKAVSNVVWLAGALAFFARGALVRERPGHEDERERKAS